jgi:ketosteroid isomerase-like protein
MADQARISAGDRRDLEALTELQPQQFIELGERRVLVFGRARVWHERGLLDSSNAWLWTLRDGKIVSVRVFADPAEARRAFSGEL